MRQKLLTLTIIFLLLNILIFPQTETLKNKIEEFIASKKAKVGVGIYNLKTGETFTINDDHHYPMQSVFKFHLALAVLNYVDEGKLSLDQKIHISKDDLLPNTWSPLHDKYPNGNIDLTLNDILFYTVSRSDNNGCDILFRLIGGTEAVEKFIHNLGIKNISIKATEEEMHKSWDVQYSNWTTPLAAVNLLAKFYKGEIISQSSFEFLWKLMSETKIGKDRIKGRLPAGTIVAHKTGLSGTNKEGITAATNDIGIITLPDGNHFAIAVFVSNSKENENADIIASVSKIAWNYFTQNNKSRNE